MEWSEVDGRIVIIIVELIFIILRKYILISYNNQKTLGEKTTAELIENQLGVNSKRIIIIEYMAKQ